MTTIKTPQTVSHAKNDHSNDGRGQMIFLLLITWILIGTVVYGVKAGMIKSDAVNPAISEKITTLEEGTAALDVRLKVLEKRLSDASSALNPGVQTQPTDIMMKPESAITPEGAVQETTEGGAAVETPASPQAEVPALKMEEKSQPEEKPSAPETKPQTDNRDKSDADQTAILEKKSSI